MYTFWALWRHKTDFDGHLTKRHQLQPWTWPGSRNLSGCETEDLFFFELRGENSPERSTTYFIFYLLFRKGMLHKSKAK